MCSLDAFNISIFNQNVNIILRKQIYFVGKSLHIFFEIEFGFIYHSLFEQNNWQLRFRRETKAIENNKKIIISEQNGVEVLYIFNAEKGAYFAQNIIDGEMRLENTEDGFCRIDKKYGEKEYIWLCRKF